MSIRIGLLTALLVACLGSVAAGNGNGRATAMPAFYDHELFIVNFTELKSESTLLAHNGSLNIIYQSDECMPDGHMFVSVLDAIQGDGFNPLWQEVQIHFDNSDFPCQQLSADDDIVHAAAQGLISLEPTTEVYRCAVIGPKQ